jgi:endoglucanase
MQAHISSLRVIAALLMASVLFYPSEAVAQADTTGPQTFNLLQHGVNVSNWFAEHGSKGGLVTIKDNDKAVELEAIVDLKADFVRLLVNPDLSIEGKALLTSSNGNLGDGIELLDAYVNKILDKHLRVVIAIDPTNDYRCKLNVHVDLSKVCPWLHLDQPQAQAADQARKEFTALWKALAVHYAKTPYDSDKVFFEIINEPRVGDADATLTDWAQFENEIIGVISQQAPDHWIIATPGAYSGLEDLMVFTPAPPPAGAKVVYTFHYYRPNQFVQEQSIEYLYPSLNGSEKPQSRDLTLEEEFETNNYKYEHWDTSRIASEIFFAHEWSHRHRLPVWCGEFGVYKKGRNSSPEWQGDRITWLSDVRKALEQNQIGWAVWDFDTDDYGITENNKPDTNVKEALFSH